MEVSSMGPALHLAKKALAACAVREGIIAGPHHFVDLWARDAFFASLGANVSGQRDATVRTIDTFLRFQRKDGLVPYRVMRSPTSWAKYRGRPTYYETPRPQYRSRQSGGTVPDGGLLAVIAAHEYLEHGGDKKHLSRWYPKLVSAMQWYAKDGKEELVREWMQCEWADSILKFGAVLYTNVLYWRALGDIAFLSGATGHPEQKKIFLARQKTIGKKIRTAFWNGKYFADWVDWKRQEYFSSFSNLLAVVLGFATPGESRNILAYVKKYCLTGWAVETNYPRYPFWRVSPMNYLVGMGDYQNRGLFWLQPAILYASALAKAGRKAEAKQMLSKIAQTITAHGDVYEVYERSGMPVKRAFYTSEGPFAWSAGLFLWAASLVSE